MYPKGTLNYEFFHTSDTPFKKYDEVKHLNINFKEESEFKFYSLVGYDI